MISNERWTLRFLTGFAYCFYSLAIRPMSPSRITSEIYTWCG